MPTSCSQLDRAFNGLGTRGPWSKQGLSLATSTMEKSLHDGSASFCPVAGHSPCIRADRRIQMCTSIIMSIRRRCFSCHRAIMPAGEQRRHTHKCPVFQVTPTTHFVTGFAIARSALRFWFLFVWTPSWRHRAAFHLWRHRVPRGEFPKGADPDQSTRGSGARSAPLGPAAAHRFSIERKPRPESRW
jgi:hypothetical protein